MRKEFVIGDVVTDILAKPTAWTGVVMRVEGSRVAVSVKSGDMLWYPVSWLRHAEMVDVPKNERPMEDTRDYLQSVTGGA